MNGLDVEAVLVDLIADDPMWIGDDGQPLDYLPEREARIADFTAHVAAVLRVEIDRALGDAWAACVQESEDCGWMHDLAADDMAARNPYRPTLAADEGDVR